MRGPMSRLATIAALLSLSLAVPAYAEDSSVDGYGGPGGNVQDTIGGGGGDRNEGGAPGDVIGGAPGGGQGESVPVNEVTSEGEQAGSLPFTGLDLGLLAAAGALLLGLGVGMRRLTRASGSA
jgi:hypothetical protein